MTGHMGINPQLGDVVYPCSEGCEGPELAPSPYHYAFLRGLFSPLSWEELNVQACPLGATRAIHALRRTVLQAPKKKSQNDPSLRPSQFVDRPASMGQAFLRATGAFVASVFLKSGEKIPFDALMVPENEGKLWRRVGLVNRGTAPSIASGGEERQHRRAQLVELMPLQLAGPDDPVWIEVVGQRLLSRRARRGVVFGERQPEEIAAQHTGGVATGSGVFFDRDGRGGNWVVHSVLSWCPFCCLVGVRRFSVLWVARRF